MTINVNSGFVSLSALLVVENPGNHKPYALPLAVHRLFVVCLTTLLVGTVPNIYFVLLSTVIRFGR